MPYDALWRYFAWCNQVLAVFTLWTLSVWLARNRKSYFITLIPAMFMTAVTVTYIIFAPEGLGAVTDSLIGLTPSYEMAVGGGLLVTGVFTFMFSRFVKTVPQLSIETEG